MEILHADCAGLDIQKDSVVACVRHLRNGKAARSKDRKVITMVQRLRNLGYAVQIQPPAA